MGIIGLRTRALGGAALADYLYNKRKEEDSVDTFKLTECAFDVAFGAGLIRPTPWCRCAGAASIDAVVRRLWRLQRQAL